VFIVAAVLIVAGVALFVAAPLGVGLIGARGKSVSEADLERCEHDRGLAVQGLKELEFDREMGKLSDADYQSMRASLEDRALTAMTTIEKIQAEGRKASVALVRPKRPAPIARRSETIPTLAMPHEPVNRAAPKIKFCPQCGTRAVSDANFCAQCGVPFKIVARANSWTE
jgi:hypothetical protein